MYNSLNIAKAIKQTAKDSDVPLSKMFLDLGIGVNALSNILYCFSLPKKPKIRIKARFCCI